MKDILIIGAGSVGGHIATNWSEYNSNHNLCGFLDDDPKKHGKIFCGLPVLGDLSWLVDKSDVAIVIGIAFPKVKMEIFTRLYNIGNFEFPNLISSQAWISKNVKIGIGSIIYPNSSINYECNIGDFVVINMNCALGHNTKIANYSSLGPGVNLGGFNSIGYAVDIGIGSSTKQNITIQDFSIIGGQAMVLNDIPSHSKYIGVPAKPISENLSAFFEK